jgi:hypothetical protein
VVLPEVTRRIARVASTWRCAGAELPYVAAIKPKVAFIFDIRRQNLVELLMYKALFGNLAGSPGVRLEVVSRRPVKLIGPSSSPSELLVEINATRPDAALHTQTLQAIRDRLTRVHQFRLNADDLEKIGYILSVFYKGGPRMDYAYASRSPNASVPSFYNLWWPTDGRGKNWSFLANEGKLSNSSRAMQEKNLIVPVVGDFAGPKPSRLSGNISDKHQATVRCSISQM